MENDSVRTSGDLTLVEMWIDGKLRGISVSREAIESFLQLPPERAAAMSEDDRREFVRTHLSLVIAAAKDRLQHTSPGAYTITIDAGQLGARGGGRMGDRRRSERRQADRRKPDQESGRIGDRRQGDRRKGDRRTKARRSPSKERDGV